MLAEPNEHVAYKRPRLRGSGLEEKLRLNTRPDGECWRWTGGCNRNGYGRLKHAGRQRVVHQLAYELWVGPIPDGLELDHLCRVRDCINPAHLGAVTHSENVRRSVRGQRGRHSHCKHGHEFTPENTRLRQPPGRKYKNQVCITCARTQKAKARARANASGGESQ